MKVITLRIYNSTPYYDEMYKIHKEFDNNSIYLTASVDLGSPTYDHLTNILTVPGKDSLIPGILEKTVSGMQYCIDHFDFDILIRSNMSTIIDYKELEKQLMNIKNPLGGHIWNYKDFKFISGCCIVMNKDICRYLVMNKSDLLYHLSDDVAIGKLLLDKFSITFSSRYVQLGNPIQSACFYRFRNDESRYDNREQDIKKMEQFYKLLTE